MERLINIKGQSNVSPEMALRLSKGLGRSPESWLAMQETTIYGKPGNQWTLMKLNR